jgi:hypothetical protein
MGVIAAHLFGWEPLIVPALASRLATGSSPSGWATASEPLDMGGWV